MKKQLGSSVGSVIAFLLLFIHSCNAGVNGLQ